ncbi:NADPH dehydrogenase [uncultured archaeon]|nr:NADPH dehydrogenase [uncultured archaeon]
MELRSVLKPLDIKGTRLRNRIVFPAFQANYATRDGFVTERITRLYEKLAQGGNGMIIVGRIAVSDDGAPNTNPLRLNSDEHIPGLNELFSIIKKRGAAPAVQLMHAGRQTVSAMTGHPVVAASAIPCPVLKEMPIELDTEGIKRIQDDFTSAAGRAKKAGAELIELHGAFGYLIGGFLSPYSNKRDDEYGNDKSLFFTEIIEKVRRKTGDIPISCRISGDEFVDGGLKFEDMRQVSQKLVEAGADVISVSAGTYASMEHMAPTISMGIGLHVYLAKGIRDSVDVPVICSDNIRTIENANEIVSENKADLVAICRPQVADHFFVKKSIRGEPVVECLDCGSCLYFLKGETSVSCPQNPEI